jgi:hypothetical protein
MPASSDSERLRPECSDIHLSVNAPHGWTFSATNSWSVRVGGSEHWVAISLTFAVGGHVLA